MHGMIVTVQERGLVAPFLCEKRNSVSRQEPKLVPVLMYFLWYSWRVPNFTIFGR